jgi:predicted MFS family arabinose efflux permease
MIGGGNPGRAILGDTGSATTQPDDSTRRADSVIRLFAIAIFAGLGGTSLLIGPAIATQLSRQLHFTPEKIGLFFSVEYAGAIVGALAARWLLPRFNWRSIAMFALLGLAVGNVLTITALNQFPLLLLIRLCTAPCGSALGILALATATGCEHPSRAVGLHVLGQLATGTVGLAVMPYLFEQFGLDAYFCSILLLLLAASPLILALAARKDDGSATAMAQLAVGRSVALLRYPAILLFYIALGGIWTFVGPIASASRLNAVSAGHILSGATFVGVVGAGLAAGLGRGVDARFPIFGGFALLIVGSSILMGVGSKPLFICGILTIKFAWSFAIPFAFTVIGRLDRNGGIVAEAALVSGVGLVVGPPVAGWLIQVSGNYLWMLSLEVLLLLGAAICTYALASEEQKLIVRMDTAL